MDGVLELYQLSLVESCCFAVDDAAVQTLGKPRLGFAKVVLSNIGKRYGTA